MSSQNLIRTDYGGPIKYFVVFILGLIVLLSSGCAGYAPSVHADQFSDNRLEEVLRNIEQVQRESDWFRDQGQNNSGIYLNLSLALGAALGGTLAAIEGTKLWKETAKPRRVLLLALALAATLNAAVGLFFKSESERFYKENRQQYTTLSIELDSVIRDFYFEFHRVG
jgi:hypothetical protein